MKPSQDQRAKNVEWSIGNEKYSLNLLRACWLLIPIEFLVGLMLGFMQGGAEVDLPGMVEITLWKLVFITIVTALLYTVFEKNLFLMTESDSDAEGKKIVLWPWRRWLATALVLWLLTFLIKGFSMVASYFLCKYFYEDSTELYQLNDVLLVLLRKLRLDWLTANLDYYRVTPIPFLAATLLHSFLACLVLLEMRRRWRERNDTAALLRIGSLGIALSIVHTWVVASGAYRVYYTWTVPQ